MGNKTKESGCSALRFELKKEREKVKKLTAELQEAKSDERLWELVKGNSTIKNKVISEYLRSLANRQQISLIGSTGVAALTPVSKPKNLADAKRLADKIIKS